MAVVWIIGAIILVQGIIQLVHCFKSAQWSAFAWNLLWAVVYVIAGGLILARPLLGAVTLTLLLAAFFIVEGVVKLGLAMKLKPAPPLGMGYFSRGVMGLVLGLIIFAGWPARLPGHHGPAFGHRPDLRRLVHDHAGLGGQEGLRHSPIKTCTSGRCKAP